MRQENPRSLSVVARALSLLLCAVFIIASSGPAAAQSGRKIPKRPTSPDPLPPKSSEPPVEESKPQDDKPQFSVMVVTYSPDIQSNTSYWIRTVVQGCLERLNDSRAVKPTAGGELNRKEASDAAKRTTDTHVVLIQLEIDPAYRSRGGFGSVDPRYLYVSYTLFSPGTGKVKTSGNVYPHNRSVGRVPLPGRLPNSTAGVEYALRYAGRETGDRVLDSLGLPKPPDKPF
jgi:hypothetical protein